MKVLALAIVTLMTVLFPLPLYAADSTPQKVDANSNFLSPDKLINLLEKARNARGLPPSRDFQQEYEIQQVTMEKDVVKVAIRKFRHGTFHFGATVDAPKSEVQVPDDEYAIKMQELANDSLVFTFVPSSNPKAIVFIHGLLCQRQGSSDFFDATILGIDEPPDNFYAANLYFYSVFLKDVEKFAICLPQDTALQGAPSRLTENKLMKSHDRAMRHLCAWLDFYTRIIPQSGITGELLSFILRKQREAFLEVDSEGDYDNLRREVTFFDRIFPAHIYEIGTSYPKEVRADTVSFLQTTLALRKKLKGSAPDIAKFIERDERLLGKYE